MSAAALQGQCSVKLERSSSFTDTGMEWRGAKGSPVQKTIEFQNNLEFHPSGDQFCFKQVKDFYEIIVCEIVFNSPYASSGFVLCGPR